MRIRDARTRGIAPLITAMIAVLFTSSVAGAGHDGTQHGIASLIAEVARVQQRIADLGGHIQSQQEAVNKALVDVVSARDVAEAARLDADEARRAVLDADVALAAAQSRFDALAASVYMRGPSISWLTATSPDEALAVATLTEAAALSNEQTMARLTRVRIESANTQSLAVAADTRADDAAAEAQRRLDDAVAALDSARTTFSSQQSELDALTRDLEVARERLRAEQPTAGISAPADAEMWTPSDAASPDGSDTLWDTTLPAVPSANVTGDPVAVINAVLQISATSAQMTADFGRRFLTRLGILSAPVAAEDSGILNGRIPQVYGRQATEFVIDRAMSQIGVPYSWGGGNANGPSRGIDQGANTIGFDCSGLVLYAFAGVGIQLDHYSGAQYDAGRKIPSSQMRRGDLIFYGPNASQHEAIYLGEGMMLEAPFTGSQVRVSPVRTTGMTPYVSRLIEW